MDKTIVASVIIPAGRERATLAKCLNSLGRMDFGPFEVIVVGDIKEIEVPTGLNVKVIHDEAKSPSRKRNKAVHHSVGRILCFIDDDVEVPTHWLATIVHIIDINPGNIIGGPNRDKREALLFRYPSAIAANVLSEGLLSHRQPGCDSLSVGIHDMPLCNMAMSRHVFDHVGGLNEDVTYYLDDVEFNYIAVKLGYGLMMYSTLDVHHDIRPAFLPYFLYKFRTRTEIGKVVLLYPELYIDSFQVRLVLLSYFIGPLLLALAGTRLLLILACIYVVVLVLSALKYLRDVTVFVLLVPGIFLTHLLSYIGFSLGLIHGIINYKMLRRLVKQKGERYKKFK